MKQFYLTTVLLALIFFTQQSWGQIKLGDNPQSLDPSALLELESTSQGLLLPRMTSAQRDAIPMDSRPVGLVIFNTDTNALQYLFEETTTNAKGEQRQVLRWESATDDSIPFTQPSNPVVGELYYDRSGGILHLWDGNQWIPVGGPNATANSGGATTTVTYQSLSLVGNQLSISNGNTVDLSSLVVSITGPIGPQGPAGSPATDDQSLAASPLSANNTMTLAISGGNTITLDLSVLDDSGTDSQTLTNSALSASSTMTIAISDGNTVTLDFSPLAATGLVSVTESGRTGHRLATAKATNHGDIGNFAIDLSAQTAASTSTGARGNYSFAGGRNTEALGLGSFAIGDENIASGYASAAMGVTVKALGDYAVAWGEASNASGDFASVWGQETRALGTLSTGWGHLTTASGTLSTAFGDGTTAETYGQTTFGFFNTPQAGSATSRVATNALFVIGNGTSAGNRSDALVMLKNGNTTLNGALTINNPTSTSSYTLPTVKGTTGQVLSIADETTGTTTWTTPSASGGGGGSGTDSQTLSLLAGSTSTTIINLNGAGSTSSSLTLVAGDNITLTENTTTGVISITATGSSGGGGGITLVTEAQKNAMTTATNGTLVYQTDGFKGIYAKESDGWRHQGKDTPVFKIDIGNINTATYSGTIYQLDASYHTIVVEGHWFQSPFNLFTLPAASSCKGRVYSFYIINSLDTFSTLSEPLRENGVGVKFSNSDAYIRLDHKATASSSLRKISGIPTHRQFSIQSDGTDWREILNDLADPALFNPLNNDGD